MSRSARPLAGLAVAACALAAGACASSQDKSAALKQGSKGIANVKGLSLTVTNTDIKILDTTVLHDQYGTAAVVFLKNTTRKSVGNVPLAIDVRNAADKSVFRNNAPGLDAALVSAALLPSGRKAVWINNQVVANGGKTVRVKVGDPKVPVVPARIPKIVLSEIKRDKDTDGPFVTGVITNRSKVPQKRLTIFAIARKGGKVVAAGRAVVDKLPPAPTRKPIRFSVYFIGNPTGAQLGFSAPPVAFK